MTVENDLPQPPDAPRAPDGNPAGGRKQPLTGPPEHDGGEQTNADPDEPSDPDTGADPDTPSFGHSEGDDGKDREQGAAGPRDDEHDGDQGTELALAGVHEHPPRPPRRTGVFLDPEDLREHVGGLLRAILGGYEVDAFGNFTFTHQGARAFVTVGPSPIGPQVGVFSVTNLDLDLTPELGTFLLTTNHKLGFGAFSYDHQNRAVWLRHTLLGSTLDLPELQSAVAAIATTAAGLDERIRDRFGGRTFQEAPDDVQRRMEPPDATGDGRPPNASGYL